MTRKLIVALVLLVFLAITAGFHVGYRTGLGGAQRTEVFLMCFNETNGTWDRCRMKGKELHNTYGKAEKLGVFCPDLLEE